jgi:hypothetical protein
MALSSVLSVAHRYSKFLNMLFKEIFYNILYIILQLHVYYMTTSLYLSRMYYLYVYIYLASSLKFNQNSIVPV